MESTAKAISFSSPTQHIPAVERATSLMAYCEEPEGQVINLNFFEQRRRVRNQAPVLLTEGAASMTKLGRTFLTLAMTVLAVLVFIPTARADSAPGDTIVNINGENLIFGSEVLNFSIQEDLTAGTLITNSIVLSGAVDCSGYAACGADGFSFEIGDDDYAHDFDPAEAALWPQPGIYVASFVNIDCGFATPCFYALGEGFAIGSTAPGYGEIVITDAAQGVPEPGILVLLLIGLVGLGGALKLRAPSVN